MIKVADSVVTDGVVVEPAKVVYEVVCDVEKEEARARGEEYLEVLVLVVVLLAMASEPDSISLLLDRTT